MNENKLKAIFIGSSSCSGSMLFDRMLGQAYGFFFLDKRDICVIV